MFKPFALILAGVASLCPLAHAQDTTSPPPQEVSPAPQENPAPAVTPENTTTTESPATPPPLAAAPAIHADAGNNQQAFDQYRRDLINLLALRADAEPLLAAAQLAYFDKDDKKRSPRLKTPSLLARAQQGDANNQLVWWISAQLDCGAICPRKEDLQKLQTIAPDNGAVWLLSIGAEKDAAKVRPLVATMAQAQHFNDYWNANVLALYQGLQTLPVPADVLANGVTAIAARLNFATSVSSALVPPYPLLAHYCKGADKTDTGLISDCLAIARKIETEGSFGAAMVAFDIEENLLTPGVEYDVMHARRRAVEWQIDRFGSVSARFARDTALAQGYLDLLHSQTSPAAAALALLRSQNISTDPPQGWQPPNALK